MAIVSWDPVKFEEANTIQVDSDAGDNRTALMEIEQRAAERGFVRTNEYYLRQLIRGNQRLFRGICYRMTQEEITCARAKNEELERAVLSSTFALMRPAEGSAVWF